MTILLFFFFFSVLVLLFRSRLPFLLVYFCHVIVPPAVPASPGDQGDQGHDGHVGISGSYQDLGESATSGDRDRDRRIVRCFYGLLRIHKHGGADALADIFSLMTVEHGGWGLGAEERFN